MLTYVLSPRGERLPVSKPSFTHMFVERIERDDDEAPAARPAYCTILAGQPQCEHGWVFEVSKDKS
jgi:hypothetical protein